MFKQNLFKHLLSILAVASITSFAGVGVSYAAASAMSMPIDINDEAMVKLCKEKGTVIKDSGMCQCSDEFPIWNAGKGCVAGSLDEAKTLCNSSGGEWSPELASCDCKKENTQFNNKGCVCKDGYKLEGAESLAEEKARCVVGENSEAGSTETPTGSDPVGAATGIKIATKSFNDARFSYVRRDLDETIATIRDVVSNAITNTNNIAALQSGKQTRPDDNHACAEGKTCLLVTDTSGIRNWYEIIDCNESAFLANVGSDYGFGNSGYYGGYTNGSTEYRACTESNANCGENQWMRSFAKGVVYGEARAVQISNSEGTIVTLPQNVQSGNVCVCRATGYRVKNGDTYGALQPISTDAWVVNRNHANTDQACLLYCAFDGDSQSGSGIDVPYYKSISNTCGGGGASVANMCTIDPWFASIASLQSVPTSAVGYNENNYGMTGYETGLCQNSTGVIGTWCNTDNSSTSATGNVEYSWCNNHDVDGIPGACQANSWVVRLSMTSSAIGGANNPELYGRAYCLNKDVTGVAAGTLFTESEVIGTKDFSGYPVEGEWPNGGENGGQLACVCQLKGYKNQTATSMTTVSNSKYLYTGQTNGKCLQTCQSVCANYFATNPTNALIQELAGDCPL